MRERIAGVKNPSERMSKLWIRTLTAQVLRPQKRNYHLTKSSSGSHTNTTSIIIIIIIIKHPFTTTKHSYQNRDMTFCAVMYHSHSVSHELLFYHGKKRVKSAVNTCSASKQQLALQTLIPKLGTPFKGWCWRQPHKQMKTEVNPYPANMENMVSS